MARITFTHTGNFDRTERFLIKMRSGELYRNLAKYGEMGVQALSQATPKDSGRTASSWGYEIVGSSGNIKIYWTNSNINDGVNIAVIIQYGHGTRNGGYVQGRDYINPAMRPVFDKIADDIWKVVTSA